MLDEEQLEVLFKENYRPLVFFAFRLTQNYGEAEDAVQDAFVKYWNHRERISDSPAAIKSYLYTSVKNACSNNRRHQVVAARFEAEREAAVETERDMLDLMLEAETIALVHRAISILPPVCRQVVRLSHFEGKKNEEIAIEMGISVNSVKTHKKRGIKMLREKLGSEALLLLFPFIF